MLNIYCPYCEEQRGEEEFTYAGEAHIERPPEPDKISDEAWGRYLFHRNNIKGSHKEMWFHATGCRKFFNVVRHTVSYDIERVYKLSDPVTGNEEGECE